MGEEAKRQKAPGAVKAAVKTLASGGVLEAAAASDAMRELMSGDATPAQVGSFLSLLSLDRCRSEIVHALADVMRANATPVELPRSDDLILDIVGTGGDGQDTFNISTAAGLVAAGAGAKIVKHGNRAATSKSGAADFLEALGAKLELAPADVPKVLAAGGFAFLFARSYHPAMKHVGPIRQELGIQTVFNILGPLTNPAKPDGIVCGVFSETLGGLFAEVFKMLGMKRALVVHGLEKLDELSIEGPTKIWELADGEIKEPYLVQPSDFGVDAHSLSEVAGGSPEDNVAELIDMLSGTVRRTAVRDMVVMNAAAALYVAGKAADFKSGADLARAAIADGRAKATVEAYIAASQGK